MNQLTDKINKVLSNFSKVFVLLLFGVVVLFYLIFMARYNYNDSPYFQITNINMYISIFLNILVFILMIWMSKFLKINFKILSAIYLFMEIIFIFVVQLVPFSDMKSVTDIALADFVDETGYLKKYGNQYPTVILFFVLFKLFYSDVIVIKVINIILNILTAYISYKIYNLIYEENNSLIFIVALFNIPSMLYVNHVYNDIFFSFFNILLIYLVLSDKFEKNNKNKKLYFALMVVLSCLQFLLRPVGVIYIIAVCMYMIFYKKLYKNAIIYAIATVVLILACNLAITKCFGKSDENINVYSYLQMGINEEEFGFQDGSHSKDYTARDVIEKAKNLGPKKLLKIFVKKELWMWSEGTYQALRYSFGGYGSEFDNTNLVVNNISDVDNSSIRKTVEYLAKGQYFVIILSAFFGLYFSKKNGKISLFNYCFVGFVCFYLVWEIKSRYIFSLYPIFAIYATKGIENIYDMIRTKMKKVKKTKLLKS